VDEPPGPLRQTPNPKLRDIIKHRLPAHLNKR
jgi:hypothetical protein